MLQILFKDLIYEICRYLDYQDFLNFMCSCRPIYKAIRASVHGLILEKIRFNTIYNDVDLLQRMYKNSEFHKYFHYYFPDNDSRLVLKFRWFSDFLKFYLVSPQKAIEVLNTIKYDPKFNRKLSAGRCFESACKLGFAELVEFMLSIDLKFSEHYYFSSFRYAVVKGSVPIVKMFLNDFRFNPKADKYLYYAAKYGHMDVVELLLRDGRALPSYDRFYILTWACQNGHINILDLLIENYQINASVNNDFAIQKATEGGYAEIVEKLILHCHSDPSNNNNYCIQLASDLGHSDIVEILLRDPRVDPNSNSSYALQQALSKGYHKIALLLSSHGAKKGSESLNVLRPLPVPFSINVAEDRGDSRRAEIFLIEHHSPYLNYQMNEEIGSTLNENPQKALRYSPTMVFKEQYMEIPKKRKQAVSYSIEEFNTFKNAQIVSFSSEQDFCVQLNMPIANLNQEDVAQGKFGYSLNILELDQAASTTIAIGYAVYPFPPYRLPGWDQFSIAYHSDDGCIYGCVVRFRGIAPALFKGDEITCMVETSDDGFSKIIYRVNGVELSESYRLNVPANYLHPTVGCFGNGAFEIKF